MHCSSGPGVVIWTPLSTVDTKLDASHQWGARSFLSSDRACSPRSAIACSKGSTVVGAGLKMRSARSAFTPISRSLGPGLRCEGFAHSERVDRMQVSGLLLAKPPSR